MPEQLTPRQAKVLAAITDAIESKGYAPTLREIGKAVGLASTAAVSFQVHQIELKGYIRRDPGVTRGLVIVKPEEA